MCVCPLLSAEILKISRREGPVCSCKALLFGPLGPTFFSFSVQYQFMFSHWHWSSYISVVFFSWWWWSAVVIVVSALTIILSSCVMFCCFLVLLAQENKSSSSSSDLVLALELVLFHCCNYSRFVTRCTAAAAATTLIKLSINLTSSSSSFSDLGAFSFCYSVCSLCLLLSSLQL